ncbi:MAG TPA: hypothetical protein VLH40_08080 [Atribacteraceae bacterium]|nr:hypothetical protein [Atribacteraceae bacterium]
MDELADGRRVAQALSPVFHQGRIPPAGSGSLLSGNQPDHAEQPGFALRKIRLG